MVTLPDVTLPPINLWTMPRLFRGDVPTVHRDDSTIDNDTNQP